MKRKGPCSHCGINSTPLWRKGPNEKPVLCNACGSRYKVKGTLQNYLPKSSLNHVSLYNLVPDHTDETDTDFWETKIPKKKRSLVVRKWISPMEKFQKKLLSMWNHSQANESSPEENLLIDNVNSFIPRNEIGLGCVLLKTDEDHSSHALQ